MKQVFEREIGTFYALFYKLGTPPHLFSFHKPWLTDSIGGPPTFTFHGGVLFFFFFLFFGISNIEDSKSNHYVQQIRPLCSHELKTVSQNEKYFEDFER
jgi:hypothetical protein